MTHYEFTQENKPEYVGKLNKAFGLNGFDKAEIGHPVFDMGDRFVLYLESSTLVKENVYENGGYVTKTYKFSVAVPFYKETLKPLIDFEP